MFGNIYSLTGKGVSTISAGSTHSACILSGEIYVFGNSQSGQLGTGKAENIQSPFCLNQNKKLLSEKAVRMVACGANHTLILGESGALYSMGIGSYGRLGLGKEVETDQKFVATKVAYFQEKPIRAIFAGGAQSCALIAHQWIPDSDVTNCMECSLRFSVIRRRHHCRNCGGVFCNICSSNRIPLLHFGIMEPNRVCNMCYSYIRMKGN